MIVNYDGGNPASSSSDYKLPLVWIDLEMTGESPLYCKLMDLIEFINVGLEHLILSSPLL